MQTCGKTTRVYTLIITLLQHTMLNTRNSDLKVHRFYFTNGSRKGNHSGLHGVFVVFSRLFFGHVTLPVRFTRL